MPTTTVIGAVSLALAATVITGCGSNGSGTAASSSYCHELRTDKAYFQSLAGTQEPDLATIRETFRRVHSLAAAAPSEVSGDWRTVDSTVTTVEGVLHESGLSPDDFTALQRGEIPQGVDVEKLAALAPKLQTLGGPAMNEAADRIAANAKSACGVDLLSS